MNTSEIKSLTGIRGIAALYVVVLHWFRVLHPTLPGTGSITTLLANFLGHGYLAVDLFFALSGFVLSLNAFKTFHSGVSTPGYKAFMYKRFCRLFPLYLVMTVVYFFCFHQVSLASFAVDLTLFQGLVPVLTSSIPPGWSLTNEWMIYFIFPFIFYFIITKRKYIWTLVPLAMVCLLVVCCFRAYLFNWANYKEIKDHHGFYAVIAQTRGPASFLRTGASYLLGIFAYFIYSKKIKTQWLGIIVVPAFLLLLWPSADFLIIMLMPALILYVTNKNWLNSFFSSGPVHYLGLISYSLYVNHYIFIFTYKSVSRATGIDSNWFSLSYLIISTLLLSTLTFYAIERPGLNWLRQIGPKKVQAQPAPVIAEPAQPVEPRGSATQ
ncbi:MAG TPA: acyltransferase [Mucilaginibacter sp.]|nr:acyltransferase [Mucilaginibacter sp.]